MSSGERGGANSLELIPVMLGLLLLVFAIVQTGLWYHARNVAQTAAAHCAERVRPIDATAADGYAAAQVITAAGGIENPQIQVSDGAITVSCTVSGGGLSLIGPFGTHTRTVTMPKERIT